MTPPTMATTSVRGSVGIARPWRTGARGTTWGPCSPGSGSLAVTDEVVVSRTVDLSSGRSLLSRLSGRYVTWTDDGTTGELVAWAPTTRACLSSAGFCLDGTSGAAW